MNLECGKKYLIEIIYDETFKDVSEINMSLELLSKDNRVTGGYGSLRYDIITYSTRSIQIKHPYTGLPVKTIECHSVFLLIDGCMFDMVVNIFNCRNEQNTIYHFVDEKEIQDPYRFFVVKETS